MKPKTLGESVVYSLFCLLLAAPFLFHSRLFVGVMTAVAAVVVVAVTGLMLTRRGTCQSCHGQ